MLPALAFAIIAAIGVSPMVIGPGWGLLPLLAVGPRVRAGIDVGTRRTFADLGQSLSEVFGAGLLPHGTSFLPEIAR